jgi:hypothetical protein
MFPGPFEGADVEKWYGIGTAYRSKAASRCLQKYNYFELDLAL